jgi:hypothetical protein
MSSIVTVNLSDTVRERAAAWAQRAGRSLPDFLAEAIESSLLPLDNMPPPVETWSNDEVLAVADASLSPDEDRRLGELLALQRESMIADHERVELASLMQLYQRGLVRKAAAIQEAVRRGLRKPLGP